MYDKYMKTSIEISFASSYFVRNMPFEILSQVQPSKILLAESHLITVKRTMIHFVIKKITGLHIILLSSLNYQKVGPFIPIFWPQLSHSLFKGLLWFLCSVWPVLGN
jgi:hypothetical protein